MLCRDGGAVERARFEIVLCRNVYKGSNPFLCATKRDMSFDISFFVYTVFRKRFEGGRHFAGAKWFALRLQEVKQAFGQTGELIILHWGAPLKAQIPFSAPRKKEGLDLPFFVV